MLIWYHTSRGWCVAPPPLWNPADTLRRRGDLAITGRQPISLAPTAQWVTSGEDWSYGRQPRQKIWQCAMPQGRIRPSSSKRPDTYPTPALQVAGGKNLLTSFPLNCGQRFSVPQRSFQAQQWLGGPLAAWIRKRLRSVGGRPLMMMMMNYSH